MQRRLFADAMFRTHPDAYFWHFLCINSAFRCFFLNPAPFQKCLEYGFQNENRQITEKSRIPTPDELHFESRMNCTLDCTFDKENEQKEGSILCFEKN